MSISPITKEQWVKVLKALAYSFASGFVATSTLVALDFIVAAKDGTTSVFNLGVSLVVASAVGGVNAVFVTVKQLFTESK